MSQLYEQICEFERLDQAFQRARLGKRHQESVACFEKNLEIELFQLQEELIRHTYRPGPYRSFYRTEAKRRLISAAPFRDRVVHHALVSVLEPTFESRFIFDSYANRAGKGTHKALDRCTQYLRAHQYVLACDVQQFFPSVDHQVLRAQLQRVIPQPDVLGLIDSILANGTGVLDEEYQMHWFPGDDLFAFTRQPRALLSDADLELEKLRVYLRLAKDIHCLPFKQYEHAAQLVVEIGKILGGWIKKVPAIAAEPSAERGEGHSLGRLLEQ